MRWLFCALTAFAVWAAAAQPETPPPPSAPPALYLLPSEAPEPSMAAEVIGTPQAIALPTSASPGAQSVTVPADAEGVIVFWTYFGGWGSTSIVSLTSDFSSAFTNVQQTGDGTFPATGLSYADVTSTGAKIITPVWENAPSEGPIFIVAFIKGAESGVWIRDTAFDRNTDTGPVSATVNSTADDLVICLEQRYSNLASLESGWSSIQTQINNSETGLLRTANVPGPTTTTANGQDESYSSLALGSIISAAGGGPVVVDLVPMLWSYTQDPLSAEAASSVSMAVMAYSYTQPPIPAEAAVSVISQPMLWSYSQQPLSGDAASAVTLLPMGYVYNWLPLGVGQSASVDLAPMLWTYHQDPLSVGVAASVSLSPMAYSYTQPPLSAEAASSVVTATMAWAYQQNPLVPAVGSGVTLSPMLWTYHQDPLSASTPATVDLLPMLWGYFQDPLSAEAAVAIDLDLALWAYHQTPLAPAVGSGTTLAPMLWSYTQNPLPAGVPKAVDLGAMLWAYSQDPLTAEAASAADLDPMLWRYFSSLESPPTGMQIADPGAYYLGIGYNSHFKGLGYNARFK